MFSRVPGNGFSFHAALCSDQLRSAVVQSSQDKIAIPGDTDPVPCWALSNSATHTHSINIGRHSKTGIDACRGKTVVPATARKALASLWLTPEWQMHDIVIKTWRKKPPAARTLLASSHCSSLRCSSLLVGCQGVGTCGIPGATSGVTRGADSQFASLLFIGPVACCQHADSCLCLDTRRMKITELKSCRAGQEKPGTSAC